MDPKYLAAMLLELDELQTLMNKIAGEMQEVDNNAWKVHGRELAGAAAMIGDWCEGIEEELQESKT